MLTFAADQPHVLRTSYANQRQLAARELGTATLCGHGVSLGQACDTCRRSGCVLLPEAPAAATCPVCDAPLGEHVGGKPCVQSPPSTARHLHDLPIFGWAWGEDGRDRQA